MDTNNRPPVNNALLPDIYNKLDADLRERTRVINTQLDKRLVLQEKVLNKYRRAAERYHKEESFRIRQDLLKINNRLPAVGNVRNFCLGYFPRQNNTTPRKMKGIPEEKPYMPFCERHFIHHLSTKKMYYRKPSPIPPFPVVDEHVVHILAASSSGLDVNGAVTVGDAVKDPGVDEVGTAEADVRPEVSASASPEIMQMPADETDRPVNKLILPDIYIKLDVALRRKTRVMDAQLESRQIVQQTVLTKYRKAAERFYREEALRITRELIKIKTKIPEGRNLCMVYRRKHTLTRKIRGVPEEKPYMPFCMRHYIHHLPTKEQYYKALPFRTLRIMDSHAVIGADRTEAFGEVVKMDDKRCDNNLETTITRRRARLR